MPPVLTEGRVVAGRYRLDRRIGQGGTSVVWSATHVVTRKRVALKVLLEAAASADGRRRMEREARAASAVKHPGVITVHDVIDLEDGTPVLVMDLLEGESLAELLEREKRLDVDRFARLMLPVVSALGAAHAEGIVHRDLKPANIFILSGSQGEPDIKVLDFGIAKLTASEGDAVASTALTGTGMILGTPSYMAPEQVLGEADIDRRADVWALGCIFYEALAGQRPTSADTVGKILRIILTGTITPLAEVAPELPADLTLLVSRMLAFSRENRPDDLREVLEVLSAYSTRSVPKFAGAVPPPPTSSIAPARLAGGGTDDLALAPTMPEARASRLGLGRRRVAVLGAFGAAIATIGAVAGVSWLRREDMAPPPPPLHADLPNGHCPVGMAELAGGTFTMGADDGAPEERPAHPVDVASFCLDRTEVTAGAYAECVDEGACTGKSERGLWVGKAPAGRAACADASSPDAAASCVSWEQAQAFCRARSGRLPSEAEWEYAARNGVASDPWPWGAEAPSTRHALLCEGDCGDDASAAIAALAAGPWPVGARVDGASRAGVLDLVGNVWEWTSSALCPYAAPSCAAKERVFRGGGWTTVSPRDARPTARRGASPTQTFGDVGFRCARDAG